MIRWLLDTDHVSLQERGHPVLRQRLKAVPPETVTTSAVTLEEMLRGRLAVLARNLPGELRAQAYQKLIETVSFFNQVPIFPFDVTCEEKFQEFQAVVHGCRAGRQREAYRGVFMRRVFRGAGRLPSGLGSFAGTAGVPPALRPEGTSSLRPEVSYRKGEPLGAPASRRLFVPKRCPWRSGVRL